MAKSSYFNSIPSDWEFREIQSSFHNGLFKWIYIIDQQKAACLKAALHATLLTIDFFCSQNFANLTAPEVLF